MSTAELYCFRVGDFDTIVAADPDDARAVWCAEMGEQLADYPNLEVKQLADDATVKIWCDRHGQRCERGETGASVVAKTAAEWIAGYGRGLLCTTEG